jgi:hypothetical protein
MAKVPDTFEDLQNSLNLAEESYARQLVKAKPVEEAFRQYHNRYLKSKATSPEKLEDWKLVDAYIYEARLRSKTPEIYMQCVCRSEPYNGLPHIALFVWRVMQFLKSEEGKRFDRPSTSVKMEFDRDFERCQRIVSLLGFLLKCASR